MPTPKQSRPGGSSPRPCSVSSARREVIANKLLTALDDEGRVAILATEIDLILFIKALAFYDTPDSHEMAKDLLQLKQAAFPQNVQGHPCRAADGIQIDGLSASDAPSCSGLPD